MFLLKSSLKSLSRKPYIVILLIVNIAIMTAAMFVILTMLNDRYHTMETYRKIEMITLARFPALEPMLQQKQVWKNDGVADKVSLLGTTMRVSIGYEGAGGEFSVYGRDEDTIHLNASSANDIVLQDDECILSHSLAAKLNQGTDGRKLIGRHVEIGGHTFKVVAVDEGNPLESAAVTYRALLNVGNPIVTYLSAVIQSEAALDRLLTDLEAYNPTLINQEHAETLADFTKTAMQYAALSALLFLFSFISFIQLFQYKLKTDEFKWNMFYLHGARKPQLVAAAALEAGGIMLVAFALGYVAFRLFDNFVYIPAVQFLLDRNVLLLVGLIAGLLYIAVLIQLHFSIRKRGDNIVARISV